MLKEEESILFLIHPGRLFPGRRGAAVGRVVPTLRTGVDDLVRLPGFGAHVGDLDLPSATGTAVISARLEPFCKRLLLVHLPDLDRLAFGTSHRHLSRGDLFGVLLRRDLPHVLRKTGVTVADDSSHHDDGNCE